MHVQLARFWLQKDGNSPHEYEDAFASNPSNGQTSSGFRCAIADGATDSAFARTWAQQLVGAFAAGRLTAPQFRELSVLQAAWTDAISRRFAGSETSWFIEPRIEDGAFAALLGLELVTLPKARDVGIYCAVAVGDCCLVHVRGDQPRHRFPLETSADFTTRPMLLSSRASSEASTEQTMKLQVRFWRTGDTFFLMTDALAHWFYAAMESGDRPWRTLGAFDGRDRRTFRSWAHSLRSTALKNDDITLLRVTVS